MSSECYDSIQLTEEEIAAALLEGRKKKYFHEKHKDYWQEQERPIKRRIVKDEKELLK